MLKYICTLIMLVSRDWVMAQQDVEMADKFRGEGKIYVVIAVILVILFGIFYSLIRLDKRISKLEKEELKKNT